MKEFVHLHVHSHYSLLDALPKVDELVETAKKRGFSALALTDHGNMYGAIEFYQECEKNGIKPIIGVEAYVVTGSRLEKNEDQKPHHLVLLALNMTGYKNLIKLVSISQTEGFFVRPRMDKEILRQYHEGIVALSGCFSSELARAIRKDNNWEKAKEIALEYENIFGKENYYLEMLDLPTLDGQAEYNANLIKLSKETGVPLVVTRDSHYLETDDAEAQDILTCIRDGKTLEDGNRMSYASIDSSFCGADDVWERFSHIPEALENTVKIAARVDLKLE